MRQRRVTVSARRPIPFPEGHAAFQRGHHHFQRSFAIRTVFRRSLDEEPAMR